VEATATDEESVVGDECHIISSRSEGPRYDASFPQDRLDSSENLILLCRVHHKMVDDQTETYTAEILRKMKLDHELWVSQKLDEVPDLKPLKIRRLKNNIPAYLTRLTSGKELLNLVLTIYALYTDEDELKTEEEVDLVGNFLQTIRDLIDIGNDLEPADRVKEGFGLSQSLKELEHAGFFVFGGREMQIMEGGGSPKPSAWPVAYLRVVRTDNNDIIAIDMGESKKKDLKQNDPDDRPSASVNSH
jgi:hypothetical protein